MKIVLVSIDRVQPYWRNPRKNDKAVKGVSESIQRFGFNSPIVVDSEMVVIAGHTRLRAARLLGLTEVPVVVAELPPEKAKAYRIADNAAGGIATWDEAALAEELRGIDSAEDMGVFFKPGELEALLTTATEDDVAQAVPEARETVPAPPPEHEAPAPLLVTLSCPHCSHEFNTDARKL